MSSVRVSGPGQDLAQLDAHWQAAEESIKRVEHFAGEPPVAPINELRYSGRHLLDGLLITDVEERKAHHHKACRHALRAKYDAAEAFILHCERSLHRFKIDYAKITILPVLSQWLEILTFSAEVQKRIRSNRSDKGREEKRGDDHSLFTDYADKFGEYIALLDVAREELNKHLEKKRSETRRWAIGTSLVVIGLLVGIGLKVWL